MSTRIRLRHDTAADWTTGNPVLAKGEPGYEDDTGSLKFGDGLTPWNALDYFAVSATPGSGGGTTLTDDGTGLFIISDEGTGTGGPVTVNATHKVEIDYCQSELAHGSYTGFENDTKIREVLQAIVDLGGKRVRVAAWWIVLEPVKDAGYVWTGMDRFMNAVDDFDLEPLVCITAGNTLAPTGATYTDYGQLCGALAARYGVSGTRQCSTWEIWNEPNGVAFAPPFAFGAAGYTPALIAGYNAIKAADPTAFVVSAGLMSTVDFGSTDIAPDTFLQGIYDNGGKDHFDAIGFHWYSGATDFSGWVEPSPAGENYQNMLDCRAIAIAHGDGDLPFWITELGLDRSGNTVDPNVRTEWLLEQLEMVNDLSWIETAFVYNLKDSNASDGIHGFGTLDFNLVKQQPLYDAIRNINAISPRVPAQSLTLNKFIDGLITGGKLAVGGTGGAGKFLAYAADGTLTAATPSGGGGGGSLPGYVAVLTATAAATWKSVSHGLNTWNVDMTVTRSSLHPDLALTAVPINQVIEPLVWRKIDENTSEFYTTNAFNAGEFIVSVTPTDATFDTTGPTAGTISSPAQGITTVDLLLTGGTDAESGVGFTEWLRDAAVIGTSAGNTFRATGLPLNPTTSVFTARRVNLFGKRGTLSNALTKATLAVTNVAPIGTYYQSISAGSGVTSVIPDYADSDLTIGVCKVCISHAAWLGPLGYDVFKVEGTLSGLWQRLDLESLSPDTDIGSTFGQSQGGVHLFYRVGTSSAFDGETLTFTVADATYPTMVNARMSLRQYEMVDQASPFGTPVVQNTGTAVATSITVPSAVGSYTLFGAAYNNAAGAPTGYNRNLVGSVLGGSSAGLNHYLVDGEFPGAASVAHTIPTAALHTAFGVNLKKAS